MVQLQYKWKNLIIALIGLFFVYLIYALWSTDRSFSLPDVPVDLKELINYCVLSAYRGAHGIRLLHETKTLQRRAKGKTDEGATEFVTEADLISNALILETLGRFPGIRVISEEKAPINEETLTEYRASAFETWTTYKKHLEAFPSKLVKLSDVAIWVDPLDATQEYTENLLQYVSVMICISIGGRPVFGVINRPFAGDTVWGLVNYSVYPEPAEVPSDDQPLSTIVVSRSHSGKVKQVARAAFTQENPEIEPAGGSGYKMLRVLNNTADIYVHVTTIKKWDLCAGHAIIEAAGGRVTNLDGEDLNYEVNQPAKLSKGVFVTRRNHFTYLNKISSYVTDLIS